MKILWIFIFLFSLGCSVKEAYAPGKPPETKNKLFSAADFRGEFVSEGKQTLFLWPTERDGVPMTRDEKIDARANIVALSDELTDLKVQVEVKQAEIAKKIQGLIIEFVGAKCGRYQFCEDDDFLCEVDPEAQTVDEWKEPENDEEAKAIASCQENLADRKKAKKEINPLVKKATEVTVQLGTEIGGENERSLDSIEASVTSDKMEIRLKGFEGLDFKLANQSTELKAGNIVYDKKNGFLAFQVPAMKKNSEGELEIFGDYIFKLEIGDVGETVPLNGDIQFFNNQTFELKTGRAALVLKVEGQ